MEGIGVFNGKQVELIEAIINGIIEIIDSYLASHENTNGECKCPTIGCHEKATYIDHAFIMECKRLSTEARTNIIESDQTPTNNQLQMKTCLSLYYYCWKHMHNLKWDLVDLHYRYVYECTSFLLSIYTMIYSVSGSCSSSSSSSNSSIVRTMTSIDASRRAVKILDMGLINGARGPCHELMVQYASSLHMNCDNNNADINEYNINSGVVVEQRIDMKHLPICHMNHVPIDIVSRVPPDLITFQSKYLSRNKPLLIKNAISDWPAMSKWSNLEYLRDVCGHRYIPIEIGGYLDENAKSTITSMNEFIGKLSNKSTYYMYVYVCVSFTYIHIFSIHIHIEITNNRILLFVYFR